jgi:hypothetical protein
MQSVSSHLLGDEKLLVNPRAWAIHVIHLIMTQPKETIVAPCHQREQPNYARGREHGSALAMNVA